MMDIQKDFEDVLRIAQLERAVQQAISVVQRLDSLRKDLPTMVGQLRGGAEAARELGKPELAEKFERIAAVVEERAGDFLGTR
ncbi:MAG: hypothetical protein JRD89_00465 [Deltaproteobacteria bacterium]|nr:hypothetical protein [Deltaproteobacteria bacterium]